MELYHLEAKPDDNELINLGFDGRKPVFGVYNQIRPKSACSATEPSLNIEILQGASWAVVLSR